MHHVDAYLHALHGYTRTSMHTHTHRHAHAPLGISHLITADLELGFLALPHGHNPQNMHSSTLLQVHRLASQSASRSIHSRLRWQQNCGLPAAPCFLCTLKPLVTGFYTHTHTHSWKHDDACMRASILVTSCAHVCILMRSRSGDCSLRLVSARPVEVSWFMLTSYDLILRLP